jgi:sterol desaturase/sphingolipid hydroxylase (fatty acid hydroxylase superfamily)
MAKLYASNKDESARIFKSDFLEMFTHVHWSVPIIVFLPIVAYFLYATGQDGVLGVRTAAGLFVFGIFFWTITEYILHRFVFHYQPKSSWGQRLHFMMHGVHHDYPNDTTRLVMPPSVSLPLATLFYGLFTLVLGTVIMKPFLAGFLLGYILYDEIHYATHHAPIKGGFFQKIKHHHVLHHYKDPERGYGVTSPLWDHVFGTYYRPEEESLPTSDAKA